MSFSKHKHKVDLFRLAIMPFIASLCIFYPFQSEAQTSGDAVEFTNGSYLTFSLPTDSLDDCTIELWVNPAQNIDTMFLFYIGEADVSGFGLYSTRLAGVPFECAEIWLGGVIESATGNQTRLPLNTWTHLAMTRSGNIWKLYKNGSLVGRGNQIPQMGSGKAIIGKGFAGMMDEIRFWKRELSQNEIRSSMNQSLQGNENDLRIYYVMDAAYRRGDSVVVNKADSDSTSGDAYLILQGSRPNFIPSSLLLSSSPSPQFTLKNFPSHLQFFARNKNGYAPTSFDGSIDESGYDSIILKKWKNDLFEGSWSLPIHYTGNIALFHFMDSIHAEQSQYTYTLNVSKGGFERFLAEAADIITGDAFFINGQSNAHPAISWYSNINPILRTFGFQTPNGNTDTYDPADTSWGYGNSHGYGESFGGPYLVGVWANRLESNILYNYSIPTCIINGAAGGSTIEQNLPNEPDPLNLTNIYGRALYRSMKSGMQKKYRALVWYQGEYNSVLGYYDNFKRLYNDWLRDYGDNSSDEILKKIYLFQIHPGCVPGERSALRELQRTMPDSLSRIEVMSTCGVSGHDGCHYDAFGYWHIGDNIFRLIARDFYGSTDTIDISPPNILQAWYADSAEDVIILKFANAKQGLALTPDTLVGGKLRQLKDYFYLDSISGNIRSVFVKGDSVVLGLSAPSLARRITYLPDMTYNNDDTDIYEGPWIVNKRGIGALSFYDVPITQYIQDSTTSEVKAYTSLNITLHSSPNPVAHILTLNFTLEEQMQVEFDIIDLLGKIIIPLGKRNSFSGKNICSYDLSALSPGEYLLRMIAGSNVLTQKIILAK